MNSPVRFRINRPAVVHEIFDDEAVIINLDSGNYYSLDRAGADIWGFVESGATVSEIVEAITRRYDGTRVDVENAVDRLIFELQQEDLIVPAEAKGLESASKHNPRVETDPEVERLLFQIPVLHKYTDMQDLLLLDPIHEVDEMGWPIVTPEFSTDSE